MRILVIPDVHFPYEHPSFFKDLGLAVSKNKPDAIVIIGDLIDCHAISKHTPESDAKDATSEFNLAKSKIAKMAKILGNRRVFYCLGNHEMRISKVASSVRIPSMCLKSIRDIFDIPRKWSIVSEKVLDGTFFVHYRSVIGNKAATSYGMNVVQGHLHAKCSIEYFQTPTQTLWQAFTGCYADDASIAMRYSLESAKKSVRAFLLIEDRVPRLIRPYRS